MFHQSLELASILSPLRYCGSVKGAPEVVAKHGPVRNMTEILCFFSGCLFREWFKDVQKCMGDWWLRLVGIGV